MRWSTWTCTIGADALRARDLADYLFLLWLSPIVGAKEKIDHVDG